MQEKNTERLKFQDFDICPNILHVDADRDADRDADAWRRGYGNSSSALKCRHVKNKSEVCIWF